LDGKKPRTGHSPERTPADCPPLKGVPVQPRGGPPRSPAVMNGGVFPR